MGLILRPLHVIDVQRPFLFLFRQKPFLPSTQSIEVEAVGDYPD